MVWNVYYYDFNARKIAVTNILAHRAESIKKIKKGKTKQEFAEELRHEMMYHYWSKCEWEILICAWCGGDGKEEIKIDVYDQLRLNWDAFVNYCWENC